jgi:hypothetical protein
VRLQLTLDLAAVAADIAQLDAVAGVIEESALIARSARELSADEYRPAQVEGALRGAFGVDTPVARR